MEKTLCLARLLRYANQPMNLIRAAFWIALFVASTFCFLVLFEHGFSNFGDSAKKEVESLKVVFGLADKKKVAPPVK